MLLRKCLNFLAKCRIDCAFHFEYFPLNFPPRAAKYFIVLRFLALHATTNGKDYGEVFRLTLWGTSMIARETK